MPAQAPATSGNREAMADEAAAAGAAEQWDGAKLAALYHAASTWLATQADRVDALNVFPVPDGDTGANMRLTMAAAVQALAGEPPRHAGEAAERAARAALIGARGNSGVILSQVLSGLAVGLRGHEQFGVGEFAAAWMEARRAAYQAVTKPVEGTMLTVVKEVAVSLAHFAAEGQPSLPAALDRALATARSATARTPDLLPTLRAAGVVDAGAEGLTMLLEGMQRQATGQSLDEDMARALVRPKTEVVSETAHVLDENGYCTNFLVRGATGDAESFRQAILALGTSAVVVSSGDLIKVHVHTERPGAALEAGSRLGELTAIEIVNMRDQVAKLGVVPTAPSLPPLDGVSPEAGLVVVAPSEGLLDLFRGMGAATVQGGQTMNPSVGQILEAIKSANAREVLVLPNNGNVVLTAREAARLSERPATVVPTTSVPQGVAAAVAYLPDRGADENAAAMQAAAETVTTIEVTVASRACTIGGQAVMPGQAIALIDGELATAGADPEEAAVAAVTKAHRADHSLLTVYRGEGVTEERLTALRAALAERLPDLEVEVVASGQPHYPYLIALE